MVPSRFFLLIFLFLLLLTSCSQEAAGPPPLVQAYAGPASLPLRFDISPRSRVVATVQHGDSLDVVEVKRRFVRVRGPNGVEGWTDVKTLLSGQQIQDLRDLTTRAAKMPSEGSAVVLEAVNMHPEPNRLSASFYLLPEKAQLQVLDRKVALRSQPAPPSISIPRRAPIRKATKKKPAAIDIQPPRPPAPPPNWIEMSKTPKPEPKPEPPKTPEQRKLEERRARLRKQQGPASDDWSLVRTKEGKAGWVLSRMINMAIPDDVAQYAEGHRITSYFSLGKIADEENGTKDHWLWTTMGGVRDDCDFDAFRIFIWNRRRHRYETAYMEKRVIGRYPVEANIDGKTGTFAVITQDENSKWLRRTFALEGYQVHKLGEEPYEPGKTPLAGAKAAEAAKEAATKPSFLSKIKQKLSKLFGK